MASPFDSITKSLHRSEILNPPAPPVIDPAVARLAPIGCDVVSLFRTRALDAKMKVLDAAVATLGDDIARELLARGCKTVVLSSDGLFTLCGLAQSLSQVGVRSTTWSEATLDSVYDVDAGVTDAYRAVAETGSLVVKASTEHGRAASLVPPIHFAVLRKSQIVPDLIDLMAELKRDGSASGTVIITGPSKTADIEMNLVTGVHGPGEVVIFLID